ncbi:hypothetical protein C0995_009885 [Termitomyces sp. Mi166|nr:hypothetical protein C0995_009885 [Termitomyces sp. Mi166\
MTEVEYFAQLMPKADLAHELENIDNFETTSEPSLLPRNDTDLQEEELIGKLKRLHVDPPQGRFFGKSSGYQLVQTALDIQSEYVGKALQPRIIEGQRSQFWLCPEWHPDRFRTPASPAYSFPEEGLLMSLVILFFEKINPFFPLFHRPSFETSVVEGLHTQDPSFGATLLLVCALGSRYSDDPRVLYDGTTSTHSAGWKWFEQCSVIRRSFIPPPSLRELQNFALSVLFASSSETPQGCWTELGTALRMAQEVGAHRRRTLKAPTAEDELWKRAFCYDVDLPVECDDEYWEPSDPSRAFKQPPDMPSSIAYFNCYIKLMDILACAMRALYSVKKHINGQETTYTDQKIIMDLDSKLNDWMDSVPDHRPLMTRPVRWDPTSKNKLFLQQSATLYATYYHLQIFITAFTSAVVLLLNIWSGKRSGVAPHPKREIDDVQRCLNLLKACETRWCSAGRYRDILIELALAGDLTFSDGTLTTETTAGHKRPRDCDLVTNANLFAEPPKELCEAVASRHISAEVPSGPVPTSPFVQPLNFDLPMYGNELGRLPVYGQFNFLESRKRPRRDPVAPDPSGFQAFSPFQGGSDAIPSSNNSLHGINPQTTGYAEPRWGLHNPSQAPLLSPVPLTPDQSVPSLLDGMPFMDSDTLTMWSTAPTGFEYVIWLS